MPQAKTTEHEAELNTEVALWCGTASSYDACLLARNAIHSAMMAGTLTASYGAPDASAVPHLLKVHGNIGIVSVAGPLTNEDSVYNRFFGITSYADVRRAATAAAIDPNVKKIALDIGSGGGAVSGVDDTAKLLSLIDKTMKPVHAFSGSTIASAALWLGASARSLDVGATTIGGSIGILSVHTETSKMMKDMGVTRTVLRSGQYKALVNGNEPLTEAAKAQALGMMDHIYGVFMGHVAASKKMDYAKADAAFGQGREFVGQQLVDVGLAKSVTTFDQWIAALQTQVDKSQGDPQNAGNYQRGTTMKYKSFSQPQVDAMLASGMTEDQVVASDAAAFASSEKIAAEAKIVADAAAALKAKTDADALIEAAKTSGSLTALVDRIASQEVALSGAKTSEAAAVSKAVALEAQLDTCKTLVASSLNTMRVGLGQTASDLSAASVTDLLAQHATAKADFDKKFPGGQVSALSSTSEAEKNTKVPDWARIASATASKA